MNAFEQFWTSYPKKVGKLAAKREWDRLRPTPEIIMQITEALTWQRETWDDPQFIPHPKTWLHQGRWMDEPVEAVAPRSSATSAETHTMAMLKRWGRA